MTSQFSSVRMLTPAQHKAWEPNAEGAMKSGCDHHGCGRWASHVCVYERGSIDEPKRDGVSFRCSNHLQSI